MRATGEFTSVYILRTRRHRVWAAAALSSVGGRVRRPKSMLTEDKANRVHNSGAIPAVMECSFRAMHTKRDKKPLFEIVMFPETDELSNIISDTVKVVFKRRLVDRVLRLWTEMARGQGFP